MINKGRIISDNTTPANGDTIISYLASAAGGLFTHETVGGKTALDVNIAKSTGQFAEDSAHTTADIGNFMLAVRSDALGSLVSADGDYAPLQVDADGLLKVAVSSFTSNYEYAEDSAHASGNVGAFVLAVRHDAGGSLAGTDGDYAPFQLDATGRLRVAADLVSSAEYAEDSAHNDGDIGNFILGVRRDANTSLVGATGDYAPFQVDALGAVRVSDRPETTVLSTKVSVTTTAGQIPASSLANRKKLMVQNIGSATVFLGGSAVTASGATQGASLLKGDIYKEDLGPSAALFGIVASGTNDVIALECA